MWQALTPRRTVPIVFLLSCFAVPCLRAARGGWRRFGGSLETNYAYKPLRQESSGQRTSISPVWGRCQLRGRPALAAQSRHKRYSDFVACTDHLRVLLTACKYGETGVLRLTLRVEVTRTSGSCAPPWELRPLPPAPASFLVATVKSTLSLGRSLVCIAISARFLTLGTSAPPGRNG